MSSGIGGFLSGFFQPVGQGLQTIGTLHLQVQEERVKQLNANPILLTNPEHAKFYDSVYGKGASQNLLGAYQAQAEQLGFGGAIPSAGNAPAQAAATVAQAQTAPSAAQPAQPPDLFGGVPTGPTQNLTPAAGRAAPPAAAAPPPAPTARALGPGESVGLRFGSATFRRSGLQPSERTARQTEAFNKDYNDAFFQAMEDTGNNPAIANEIAFAQALAKHGPGAIPAGLRGQFELSIGQVGRRAAQQAGGAIKGRVGSGLLGEAAAQGAAGGLRGRAESGLVGPLSGEAAAGALRGRVGTGLTAVESAEKRAGALAGELTTEAAPGGTPTGRTLGEAASEARATGRKAAEEKAPVPANELAFWINAETGRPITAGTSLSEARRTAVRLSPAQLQTNQALATASPILQQWASAANILFPSDDPVVAGQNAIRYKAAASTRGIVGQTLPLAGQVSPKEMEAIATTQEAQNNFLLFVRNLGERGVVAARILEKIARTGPQLFETKTTSRSRLLFYSAVLAGAKLASGHPLIPSERKLFQQIDTLAADAQIPRDVLADLRVALEEQIGTGGELTAPAAPATPPTTVAPPAGFRETGIPGVFERTGP